MARDTHEILARLAEGVYPSNEEALRLSRRLEKLGEIVEASRSLMGAVDMRRLLTEILSKTRLVMNADKASIFLVDRERREIFASVTLDGSEIRLPLGSGIIGHVAETGETVNIPDAYADERFNRANDLKTGYRTRSILCMPICNPANEITGAIQILNRLDGSSFDHEDEELLAAFAGLIGVCLENARAYEELAAERNSLEDKVVERTFELALAKAETDQILQAVEEGLFLLYRSGDRFVIGAGHSRALTTLFEQEELRSKDFLLTIGQFVESAVVEKTRVFLELMFDERRNAAMLAKLNPLELVAAHFTAAGKQKHLRLHFVRVMRENAATGADKLARSAVGHLLVTVSDATQEIALTERLARTQAENQLHTELIRTILQSDPVTLAEFLQDLEGDLEAAREFLDGAAKGQISALEQLFRVVHSIKGNASILEFSLLSSRAHDMESEIDQQLKPKGAGGAGMPRLREQLEELERLSLEVSNWLGRIEIFHENYSRQTSGDYLQRALSTVFARALQAEGKEARLQVSGLDLARVPARYRKNLKDLLVQLARNAAVHGIETPSARQSKGKPAQGLLKISAIGAAEQVVVVIEDDGAGIDAATLGAKLIKRGTLTEAAFAAMPQAERLNLVFASGLSRLGDATHYAGRGMGMSIVADAVAQMQAIIRTESEPDRFTRFTVEIPATAM
ncbi:MAG TPA: GAF domain-containing protein [Turneriella sp.]|nr:GAF domain-containing protein [Turneriella sp.]